MKYIFETYLNIISEEQNPFDKDKYILVLNDSYHTTREVSLYIAKNTLEQL